MEQGKLKDYTILYKDCYGEYQDCGGRYESRDDAAEQAKATSKSTRGEVYMYLTEDEDKPNALADVFRNGKFIGKAKLAA